MTSYRSNITKMYLVKFFSGFHLFTGVLVPFFTSWGHLTFTQIMILQSFFAFSIFILEIPTGALADHISRKTSIILSAIFTTMAVLVYTITPNFYVFLVGEFLWALGNALFSGADHAIMYDSLKKIKKEHKSKKAFARYETAELVALMIAAPIGGIIASEYGLEYTFRLMIIPLFISFCISLTLKEPRTGKHARSKNYIDTIKKGISYFKGNSILKILAFDMISSSIVIFFVIWTYPKVLESLGVSLIYFGFISAAMSLSEIIFLNSQKSLERFFGSKKIILTISSLLPALCFIFLGINNEWIFAIVLIVLISGFGLSRQTLFYNYMHKFMVSSHRATMVSTISMIDRLAKAIAYPILGLLVEWSLDYTLIILGIAGVVFFIISEVEEEHLID